MRTKIAVLAAAGLVAGVTGASAQVYSQNIVGYVNVTAPNSQFVMLAVPLDSGNNVLTNLFKGVPGGSSLQLWTGSGWLGYTYSLGHWKQGTVNADNVVLSPGQGFFLKPSADYTNTFVGDIAAISGASVTNALSNLITPVGSLIPYAGAVTNTATFNLLLPGGSTIQKWDVATQKFLPTYTLTLGKWKQGTTFAEPVIGVAEGFFVKASSATNWVQTLQ